MPKLATSVMQVEYSKRQYLRNPCKKTKSDLYIAQLLMDMVVQSFSAYDGKTSDTKAHYDKELGLASKLSDKDLEDWHQEVKRQIASINIKDILANPKKYLLKPEQYKF